ncbi:hypothetical protein A6A19_03795 [Actinobacillus delphinicola]|uniref:Membrane protein n=1 Tax=Actinobacillus delphinicola TaxID=51161 RepID=A0A448TSI4_9PAST|nr:AhpA/YtjB family protein [Actinobacillus delphinicola]MDG6897142.1 hypothetical protein [Actinobacillus delphinicola]VEJ08959.1 membrane protein [Actinobacillus delphinicola]
MQTTRTKLIHTGFFFLIAFICFCTCVVIFYGVKSLENHSLEFERNEFSYFLQKYLAKEDELLGFMIKQGASTQVLHQQLVELVQEPYIVNAKLYSDNGNLLTEANRSTEQADAPQILQKEVTTIYSDHAVQGFLEIQKITLEKAKKKQMDRVFLRFYALQIILFLLGCAFGIGLYRLCKHWFMSMK